MLIKPHEIILHVSVHDHTPGVHPQTKVTVEQIDTLVLLDLAAF